MLSAGRTAESVSGDEYRVAAHPEENKAAHPDKTAVVTIPEKLFTVPFVLVFILGPGTP